MPLNVQYFIFFKTVEKIYKIFQNLESSKPIRFLIERGTMGEGSGGLSKSHELIFTY